jgi:phytoene synthase
MTNPIEYCQNEVKKSKSNFYYGFSFLPPAQRNAIMVIYAFCRVVDDAVDTCNDKLIAQERLNWWKKELNRAFADKPITPIGQALKQIALEFNLNKTLFEEIIFGIEMDLQHYSYKSFDDLQIYCHRVAGVVGILVAKVLGYEHPKTEEYARKLGIAFQLINIIRDVGEDAKRNRIYIPKDELTRYSISITEILARRVKSQENFIALMRFQTARAKKFYVDAIHCLPPIDREKQQAGLIMANIYLTLLTKIENSNFDVFNNRYSMSTINKLWITWKTIQSEKKRLKKKETATIE